MVPDRQKVWTDRRMDGMDGRTTQKYIPPTLSGDKNQRMPLSELMQSIRETNIECMSNL